MDYGSICLTERVRSDNRVFKQLLRVKREYIVRNRQIDYY